MSLSQKMKAERSIDSVAPSIAPSIAAKMSSPFLIRVTRLPSKKGMPSARVIASWRRGTARLFSAVTGTSKAPVSLSWSTGRSGIEGP